MLLNFSLSANINYIFVEEPRITTNPADTVAERSNTVHFTVKATGYGNFTYQWYHNGTTLSSETGKNLYIYNSMEEDTGLYYCKVCNSDNRCVSSTQAELTLSCKYMIKYNQEWKNQPCLQITPM